MRERVVAKVVKKWLYKYHFSCLNIYSPSLKRKMYTPLPYKMLELQSSPLIIKYALHFNLL